VTRATTVEVVERIGIAELRQHAGRYVDRVRAGESFEVTERGRLVALLVPPDAAALARQNPTAVAAPARRRDRRSAGARTADALAELRQAP
jgi:prevent-host-death family protein